VPNAGTYRKARLATVRDDEEEMIEELRHDIDTVESRDSRLAPNDFRFGDFELA
jgi:hypothetical protein